MLFLIIRKQFTSLSILFTVISFPINSFLSTDQHGDHRWLDSFTLVIHVWKYFSHTKWFFNYLYASFLSSQLQSILTWSCSDYPNSKLIITRLSLHLISSINLEFPRLCILCFSKKTCGFPYFFPAKRY